LTVLALALALTLLAALVAWRRRSSSARDLASLLLLALLGAGFYWRLLLGDAYAPAGGGDLASFLYPYYAYAARSLHAGTMPLWNPFVFAGMPFVGDVQNGLFYPINLIQFVASPQLSYLDMEAMAILHVWLAGAGMYLCLRYLPKGGVGELPALLGAVAFMFSDLFVMHFGNLNMIAVAAWLPIVFLLFARALESGSLAGAALAGLVLGLSSLAGHIQPTIYNGLVLAALAIWKAIRERHAGRPLTQLALVAAIAAAAAAPALLPAMALTRETPRAAFSYWEASHYSLSPLRSIGIVLPDFFGRDPATYWGWGDRVETGYIGLLPLLLAVAAAAYLREKRWVPFFVGVGGVSYLIALGDTTPLQGWSYLLPGLNVLRAPGRALYLTDFALAALAAIACQALVEAPAPSVARQALARYARSVQRSGLIVGVALLAATILAVFLLQDRDAVIFHRAWMAANSVARAGIVLAATMLLLNGPLVRGKAVGRTWFAAALALAYLDLASVGAYVDIGPNDPTASFRHPEALAFLHSDPNYYRIDVSPEAASAWQPDLGCLFGVENIRGVVNPMELQRYRRFLDLAQDRGSRLYDLLGAKYLLLSKGEQPGNAKFAPAFGGDSTTDIYLNTQAYPLALIVHQAVGIRSEAEAEARLRQIADPGEVVIVEGQAESVAPATGPERLWFSSRGNNGMTLALELSQPAYLLLTVPYCQGWAARLDGRPAAIQPADLAFMAVSVPSGRHSVSFRYTPPHLAISLGVSAGALLVTGALALHRKRPSLTASGSGQ